MLRPKEIVCKWVDAFNNHEVDDPPKIAGRYTNSLGNHNFEALYSFGVSPNFL